jgi:hypothetical protein
VPVVIVVASGAHVDLFAQNFNPQRSGLQESTTNLEHGSEVGDCICEKGDSPRQFPLQKISAHHEFIIAAS